MKPIITLYRAYRRFHIRHKLRFIVELCRVYRGQCMGKSKAHLRFTEYLQGT